MIKIKVMRNRPRASNRYNSFLLPQGALIEFVPVGNIVRVSAIDPVTTTEVCIVGDPSRSSDMLSQAAVRRLEYVLKKKRQEQREERRKKREAARLKAEGQSPSAPRRFAQNMAKPTVSSSHKTGQKSYFEF